MNDGLTRAEKLAMMTGQSPAAVPVPAAPATPTGSTESWPQLKPQLLAINQRLNDLEERLSAGSRQQESLQSAQESTLALVQQMSRASDSRSKVQAAMAETLEQLLEQAPTSSDESLATVLSELTSRVEALTEQSSATSAQLSSLAEQQQEINQKVDRTRGNLSGLRKSLLGSPTPHGETSSAETSTEATSLREEILAIVRSGTESSAPGLSGVDAKEMARLLRAELITSNHYDIDAELSRRVVSAEKAHRRLVAAAMWNGWANLAAATIPFAVSAVLLWMLLLPVAEILGIGPAARWAWEEFSTADSAWLRLGLIVGWYGLTAVVGYAIYRGGLWVRSRYDKKGGGR